MSKLVKQATDQLHTLIVDALGKAVAEGEISSELRANSCKYFNGIEWLGYVIVGTDIETEDLVAVFAFCGKKDDRYVARFADLRRRSDAVHHGHHDIKNDKMDLLALEYA